VTRAIFAKEIREHRSMLAGVAVVCVAASLLVVATEQADASAVSLGSLRLYLLFLGFLVAPLLVTRLVVREYRAKTQIFLEALPIPRMQILAVKYVFGFTALVLAAGVMLWAVASVHRPPLPGTLLLAVALRGAGFLFAIYSFLFATGLLGRYRYPLYGVMGAALLVISALSEFDITQIGPAELIGKQFAVLDVAASSQALLASLGMGAFMSGLAFVLASIREGSTASMLAEKMSFRERIFVAAIFILFLSVAGVYGERIEKPDFDLNNAAEVVRGEVTVKVGLPTSRPESAQELATLAATELAELAGYLGLEDLPRVFVIPRQDLDPRRFERATLGRVEGVLVRANISAAEFDSKRFLEWLIRQVLITRSEGRVLLESRHWLVDGLPHFWMGRERARDAIEDDRRFALRSLYVGEGDLRDPPFARWLFFRDRHGGEVAAGVAWSALHSLRITAGETATRDFLRATLGGPANRNIASFWDGSRTPWRELLTEHADVEAEAFLRDWRERRSTARRVLSGALAGLPQLQGGASAESTSQYSREVRYRFELTPVSASASQAAVLYQTLSWFDVEIEPEATRRISVFDPSEASGVLPGTYSIGDRIAVAFSVFSDETDCTLISGWQRLEVP
jgi:hypothetical protein